MARPPVDPDIDATLEAGADTTPRDGGGRAGRRARSGRSRAMIAALACGGAVGAVARYVVSLAMPAALGQFPWGTFAVNVSGSVALGFVLILLLERFPRGRLARPVVGAGFLGAYTTFSTFMVDAVELVHAGRPVTAISYVLASLIGGLVAVWMGMAAARLAMGAERRLREATG